jgi:hypothetical protein
VLALQPVLLRRAAEIAGGYAQLCELLGVSDARLKLWLNGMIRLPDPIFMKAVDIVLQDDISRASHDRRRGWRARRDSNPRPLASEANTLIR